MSPTSGKPLILSVLGTGYLGATTAACMAELGHTVIGYDISQEKVEALNSGAAPFHEPGLDSLIARHIKSGHLKFTNNIQDLADADVHFICAGTPQNKEGLAADLSQVEGAVDAIAPYLRPTAIIVGKSTVPVGTTEALAQRLLNLTGRSIPLAWNPEFLREGFAVQDTLHPDRIVFGVQGKHAVHTESLLRQVYSIPLSEGAPLVVTDWPTAELVKGSANAFLATKISFINAIAEICELTNADVTKVADAIGFDARIGRQFLNAGLGFGGGCLPKDIRAFQARATELGAGQAVAFLGEVDAINLRRRQKAVQLTAAALGGDVTGKKIAILGATFKPNSDDVRDAPSLDVARQLHAAGAVVTVHDPEGLDNAAKIAPELTYEPDLFDAVRDAEAIFVGTEWAEYRNLHPMQIAHLVQEHNVIDGRNALNPQDWIAAGFNYMALGRSIK